MTDVSLRYLLFGEDKGAKKAMEETATVGQKATRAIAGGFSKLGGQIGGEFGEILSRVGEGLDQMAEHGMSTAEKMQVAGAAVTGLGAAFTMMGTADQQADQQLNAAFQGAGLSAEEYKRRIDSTVGSMQDLGHHASETKQALATLVEMTHNGNKALGAMSLVANIAAAKHVDLNTAARMVGLAYNGNTKVFRQFGITVLSVTTAQNTLTKAEASLQHMRESGTATSKQLAAAEAKVEAAKQGVTLATKSQQDGMEKLTKYTSGQAAAANNTLMGHIHDMTVKVEDSAAAFGQKYGPAITATGVILTGLGTGLQAVKGLIGMFSASTEVATAATEGSTVATEGLTVANTELAVAEDGAATSGGILASVMDALPIIAIIAAVALLITHWKDVMRFGVMAFNAIKGAIADAFNFLKSHWSLVLAILTGPFGMAYRWLSRNFDLGKLFSSMIGVVKGAVQTMINSVIQAYDAVADNTRFSLPGWLGGGSFGLPHLNPVQLATGGIVKARPGGIIANIGEGGHDEAVVPLDGKHGVGGGDTVLVTVNGFVGNETQLAREIQRVLLKHKRINGVELGLA